MAQHDARIWGRQGCLPFFISLHKENVFVLHDKAEESKYRPSRLNIEKQLRVVLNLAEEGDLILVDAGGTAMQLGAKSYLCPEDAQLDRLADLIIPLDAIYDQLGKCKASLKLLVVDACRADVVPEGHKGSVRNCSAA